MYAEGRGVTQDYVQAVKWYRLAAGQGFAGAQTNLGLMYSHGRGVPQDYAQAIKWYRLAAEQGVAYAQANLGGMYLEGLSVPQDNVQALMWFNLAVSRLPPGEYRDTAVKYRDFVAELMTPAQIAEAEKLEREWLQKWL